MTRSIPLTFHVFGSTQMTNSQELSIPTYVSTYAKLCSFRFGCETIYVGILPHTYSIPIMMELFHAVTHLLAQASELA